MEEKPGGLVLQRGFKVIQMPVDIDCVMFADLVGSGCLVAGQLPFLFRAISIFPAIVKAAISNGTSLLLAGIFISLLI